MFLLLLYLKGSPQAHFMECRLVDGGAAAIHTLQQPPPCSMSSAHSQFQVKYYHLFGLSNKLGFFGEKIFEVLRGRRISAGVQTCVCVFVCSFPINSLYVL